MTFEKQLFLQVKSLVPNMTTRQFSRDCGMSENYYCSICSQKMPISTAAIVHLAEVLEYRERLNQTVKPIAPVLDLIANEIAERTNSTTSDSMMVQRIIATAIAKIAYERDNSYNLPPLVMGW